MSTLRWSIGFGCGLVMVTLLAGCGQQTSSTSEPNSSEQPQSREESTRVAPPKAETPVTISDPMKLQGLSDEDASAIVYQPVVALSSHHEETCITHVNDLFPSLALRSLTGELVPLDSEYGTQMTVVVFWNLQHPMGIEQLCRVNDEVVEPFQNAGVKIVAINVGDTPEDVKGFLSNIECDAVCLLDEEGKEFSQVANDILPRTYLIDAHGTVCWFDLEYSRSTRRELRNAVIYNLKTQLAAAPDLM